MGINCSQCDSLLIAASSGSFVGINSPSAFPTIAPASIPSYLIPVSAACDVTTQQTLFSSTGKVQFSPFNAGTVMPFLIISTTSTTPIVPFILISSGSTTIAVIQPNFTIDNTLAFYCGFTSLIIEQPRITAQVAIAGSAGSTVSITSLFTLVN